VGSSPKVGRRSTVHTTSQDAAECVWEGGGDPTGIPNTHHRRQHERLTVPAPVPSGVCIAHPHKNCCPIFGRLLAPLPSSLQCRTRARDDRFEGISDGCLVRDRESHVRPGAVCAAEETIHALENTVVVSPRRAWQQPQNLLFRFSSRVDPGATTRVCFENGVRLYGLRLAQLIRMGAT